MAKRKIQGVRAQSRPASALKIAARGAGMLALGSMAFSAPIWAVDASDKDTTLEEVIVTGMRKSLASSQEIKQKAAEVVDSVTAQDIGALPDRSVIEALQRIPGVQLQRTNANRDPARLSAEGGGVFIRGLSFTSNQTNGRDIFSAVNGRSLSFEDVPSELMAGVDVYKNPTADHIEGSIAGIVDLRTRKPFDSDKMQLAASVDYNHADLLQKGFWSGSALFSDNFETGIGRLGVLAAASYGNIGNRTDAIQLSRFDPATDNALGKSVLLPNSYGWRRVDWEQKRQSGNFVLQLQPSDQWLLTLNAFGAKADPHDAENLIGDSNSGFVSYVNNAGSSYQYDSNNVLVSGVAAGVGTFSDLRYGEAHHRTVDVSFNAQFRPNNQWKLTFDTQRVTSHADSLSWTTYTAGNYTGTLSFSGLNTDHPHMAYTLANPAQVSDPTQYFWEAAMDHYDDNDATEWAHRLDAEFQFNDNPWLTTLKFGTRFADKQAITRQTGWNWGAVNFPWNGAPDLTAAGRDIPGGYTYDTFPNFFRGDISLPGAYIVPSHKLIDLGPKGAYPYFQTMGSVPWGSWQPANTNYASSSAGPGTGINDQSERSWAGYASLNFGHDTALGPLDGSFGLRFVRTESEGSVFPGSSATIGGACITNCTAFTDALAYVAAYNSSNTGSVKSSNSYNDVLPSFNVRLKLTPELQARFGAGLSIYRPTFSQLSAQGSVAFTFDNAGVPGSTPVAVISGNPNLKPISAQNYDASLEWYFAPAGSVTGAVFYKKLKDYIYADTVPYQLTTGSTTFNGLITTYLNGSTGTISGFELGYQQFFDGLPSALRGLGFSGNYTYVNNSGGVNSSQSVYDTDQNSGAKNKSLPMEGLSRSTVNATLMYEAHDVSARLAYNWRSDYLLTTSAANIKAPVWMEKFGQLDASVFYSITSNVKFGVQGTNLLNARTYMDVGPASLHPRYSWTDTDRRVAFVIRATL